MCVHDHDLVSNDIKWYKRWGDCNILPVLWNNRGHNANDESLYYVEIGANIGSCLMEMLLSTNASIIAFEPHPMNLFNIKKTISLLGERYQNRLTLFPLGLGNSSEASTIYSENGNMGNSGKHNRRSINRYYSIRRSSQSIAFEIQLLVKLLVRYLIRYLTKRTNSLCMSNDWILFWRQIT